MLSKPEPLARVRRRKKRHEGAVKMAVRETVAARDGYCRLAGITLFGACQGASQWAHFGEKRRFKTRGMKAEDRHTPEGSLMLCDKHHDDYDENRLRIQGMTPAQADGPLRFSDDAGTVFLEDVA